MKSGLSLSWFNEHARLGAVKIVGYRNRYQGHYRVQWRTVAVYL